MVIMARKGRNVGRANSLRRPDTQVWNMGSQSLPAQRANAYTDNRPYIVKQFVEFGPVSTSSAGGEVDFGIAFNLGQLTQASSWTSVFDQYRIKEIELWMTPTTSTATVGNSNFDSYRVYSVIDYDDDSSTAASSLLQYENVCDTGRNEGVYRKWRPHMASQLATSGGVALAQNIPSTWINSSQTTVKHYGFKCAQLSTSTSTVIQLRARFTVEFRNVF
jgi:hypothetical protein